MLPAASRPAPDLARQTNGYQAFPIPKYQSVLQDRRKSRELLTLVLRIAAPSITAAREIDAPCIPWLLGSDVSYKRFQPQPLASVGLLNIPIKDDLQPPEGAGVDPCAVVAILGVLAGQLTEWDETYESTYDAQSEVVGGNCECITTQEDEHNHEEGLATASWRGGIGRIQASIATSSVEAFSVDVDGSSKWQTTTTAHQSARVNNALSIQCYCLAFYGHEKRELQPSEVHLSEEDRQVAHVAAWNLTGGTYPTFGEGASVGVPEEIGSTGDAWILRPQPW
ncbi:hypothetical protein BKA70DRAFT_1396001 [Coprinopsis sp. MPI-PUGE-AT-0042]|nr:hypothetical protein BKA70DRAFT_1396001 [Coprinopsis sp. MPI-PUGE-AT-0042]